MSAFFRRCSCVTSSDLLMDYLLQDRREVVEDVMLDVWRQSPPDGGWMSGHSTSHSPATVMSSWVASPVSLVGTHGWDAASVVAAVNACVILRRNNFDPPVIFVPTLTISRVLSYVCSAPERITDATTPPCGRSSPPGHAVVDGWRRDERTRDIPQRNPRSLVSSAKPTTGVQVVRPAAPTASTRSLQMPTEQGPSALDRPGSALFNADISAPTFLYPDADLPCASLLLTPSFPGERGFPTIFHAVTGSRNGNDLRMMKEPVKQCGGKNLVPQQVAPVGKARVGGQQDRAMFVASRHQLKEMMGLGWRQFGVADFIDHQHTGGGVATQPLAHQTRIRGALQGLSQVGQGRKERGIACGQGLDRERQTEVCFPHTRRSQKQHIRGCLHKGEIRQFPQQSLGERGLKGKIKSLQGFEGGQARSGHPSFRCAPVAPLDLGSNRAAQERLVGPLLLPGRLKEGW